MNLRPLRTLIAIAEHGSFTRAGQAIGLSHSAVSLHVKSLEETLGIGLVDRTRRPPGLTDRGQALVERARRMLELWDEIQALGSDQSLVGAVTVGAVPSALASILPPALQAVRTAHPKLKIQIRVGLSGELAALVRNGDLDVALATAPDVAPEGLRVHPIARERLVVIAPATAVEQEEERLLAALPFIWFSRKTWAGQQIERRLLERGILVRDAIEVESLEAITALVRHGLGVSIVPETAVAPPFPDDVKVLPFTSPRPFRVLALIERSRNPKARLVGALNQALRPHQAHSSTVDREVGEQ